MSYGYEAVADSTVAWKDLTDEQKKRYALTPREPMAGVATKKVGRNEQCPCDSGRKYKRCCGFRVKTKPPKPTYQDMINDLFRPMRKH